MRLETDGEGRAVFAVRGGMYRVTAWARGWLSSWAAVHVSDADVGIELRLERATNLGFAVLNERTQPEPDAWVCLTSALPGAYLSMEPGAIQAEKGTPVRSGRDGRVHFDIGVLREGDIVAAWSRELDRAGVAPIEDVKAAGSIVVRPSKLVLLHLVDADSGARLSGEVDLLLEATLVGSVHVGADGCRICVPADLGAAGLRVSAHVDAYANAITPLPRQSAPIDLKMRRKSRVLELLVTDGEGQPLPGVRTGLRLHGPGERALAIEARTGKDGRARVDIPEAQKLGGSSCWITLSKSGYASEGFLWMPLGDNEVFTLARTLQPAGLLSLRVESAGGQVAASVRVYATQQGRNRGSASVVSPANRLRNPMITDDTGATRFVDLRTDRGVEILAFDPARGVASASLPPGWGPEQHVRLTLAERRPLKVRVREASGRAVQDAAVSVLVGRASWGPGTRALQAALSSRTDAAGETSIVGLPDFDLRVRIARVGFHERTVFVRRGSQRAGVTLVPYATIRGRVEPFDEALIGLEVQALAAPTSVRPRTPHTPRSRNRTGTIGERGEFRITGLVPDSDYYVRMLRSAESYHGDASVRATAPSSDVVLPVTVRPTSVLRLHVTGLGNGKRGARLCTVRMYHLDGDVVRTIDRNVFLDSSGFARVVLPRIHGVLEVLTPQSWPHIEQLDLSGADRRELEAHMGARFVTIRVVDGGGTPVHGAQVMVRGEPKIPIPSGARGSGPLKFLWRGRHAGSTNASGEARVPVPERGRWSANVVAGKETHRIDDTQHPSADGRYIVRLGRRLPPGGH